MAKAKCKHTNAEIIEISLVRSMLDIIDGEPDQEMTHSNADPTGYEIKCFDCKVFYHGSSFRRGIFPQWAIDYWEKYNELNY